MITLRRKVYFCLVNVSQKFVVDFNTYCQNLFSKFSIIPRPGKNIEVINCHKLTFSMIFFYAVKSMPSPVIQFSTLHSGNQLT